MFPSWITGHLLYAAVLASVAGALMHWYQGVRRGDSNGSFFDHWVGETPGYSTGVVGALAGQWLIWYNTGAVSSMDPLTAIGFGYAFGFTTDSMIAPGKAKAVVDAANKAAGFIRLNMLPLLIGLALLAACAAMGPQPELPKTIPEQIEAANLLVDKLSDGIVDVTCTEFVKGQCTEPGKPLMPDDAISAHEKVQRAHAALMMTSGIPINGVGECIGKQRTQVACIAAAGALLTEVDRMLIAKKGGQ